MILGLDPGRDKVGWALTTEKGELLLSGIVPVSDLGGFWPLLKERHLDEKALRPWILERPGRVRGERMGSVLLGNGTQARFFAESLTKWGLAFSMVDERGTTLEARSLYWRLHRPPWWQKLLPQTLWVPPRPVDDLAAWAIVLRAVSGEGPQMKI